MSKRPKLAADGTSERHAQCLFSSDGVTWPTVCAVSDRGKRAYRVLVAAVPGKWSGSGPRAETEKAARLCWLAKCVVDFHACLTLGLERRSVPVNRSVRDTQYKRKEESDPPHEVCLLVLHVQMDVEEPPLLSLGGQGGVLPEVLRYVGGGVKFVGGFYESLSSTVDAAASVQDMVDGVIVVTHGSDAGELGACTASTGDEIRCAEPWEVAPYVRQLRKALGARAAVPFHLHLHSCCALRPLHTFLTIGVGANAAACQGYVSAKNSVFARPATALVPDGVVRGIQYWRDAVTVQDKIKAVRGEVARGKDIVTALSPVTGSAAEWSVSGFTHNVPAGGPHVSLAFLITFVSAVQASTWQESRVSVLASVRAVQASCGTLPQLHPVADCTFVHGAGCLDELAPISFPKHD